MLSLPAKNVNTYDILYPVCISGILFRDPGISLLLLTSRIIVSNGDVVSSTLAGNIGPLCSL